MARLETVVLIPESTRKRKGGEPGATPADEFAETLPASNRAALAAAREDVEGAAKKGDIAAGGLLPAYRRFDGNMYRRIPDDAWASRVPEVEILIVSGLRGIVASRDTVPAYVHSMAEPTPPFGKLNRWWHDRGLPGILAAYLETVRPQALVDLLSLEYREAVVGYADDLRGIAVKPIDFPGLGRASQPRRGEKVAEILRTGRV